MIFFAPTAEFENFSNLSIRNQIADDLNFWTVSRLVGDRQFYIVPGAGSRHPVGLCKCTAQRLFHVNMDASLSGGYDHLAMLVEPARADANDVRLGFIEQFAVIGKCLRRAKSLGSRRAAFLIRVGNCDDLDLGHVEPNSIKAVAVVASA